MRVAVVESVGLTPTAWGEAKRMLSGCIYEQKWTDLTLDQLTHQVRALIAIVLVNQGCVTPLGRTLQVSVSCRENGDLLRLIRGRYAAIFNKLSKVRMSESVAAVTGLA
jgi:hypothetical protein